VKEALREEAPPSGFEHDRFGIQVGNGLWTKQIGILLRGFFFACKYNEHRILPPIQKRATKPA
jgi:hypothetical protein